MLKTLKLKDAVGSQLAHDITEIRPGEFKGPAFRRGHTVCEADLCHLQKLGKNNLYVLDLAEDEIHENEAAVILAAALAGDGVVWKDGPREGKIDLLAERDGLLVVDTAALAAFNMVDEVMCATLHNHTLVKKGDLVAGTRAIPLVMKRAPIERAASIARQNGAVLSVKILRSARVGLVITGNEIYHGLKNVRNLSGLALHHLDVQLGLWIGKNILSFIDEKNLNPVIIGSHGHTVFHQIENQLSLQIGNGHAIATACADG